VRECVVPYRWRCRCLVVHLGLVSADRRVV